MLSSMRSRTRMWLGFCSERLLFSTSRSCLLSPETQRAATSQQKKEKKRRKKNLKKRQRDKSGIRSKSSAAWRGEMHDAHPSCASPLLARPALRSDALPGGHGHETAQLGGAWCLRESQQRRRARRVSECHEFDQKKMKPKDDIFKVLRLFKLCMFCVTQHKMPSRLPTYRVTFGCQPPHPFLQCFACR